MNNFLYILKKFKYSVLHAFHTVIYCFITGKAFEEIPFSSITRVVFVCYGNICRSAYAEIAARKFALEKGLAITFESCGLHAKPGTKPPENAVRAAKAHGLDVFLHESKLFKAENYSDTDLILGMDYSHFLGIRKKVLQWKLAKNVFLLGHFSNGTKGYIDIDDPYGKDYKCFYQCFDEIDICIKNLLTKISMAKNLE